MPQIVVTAVFFFYPAGQAIWQSLFIPDPFGLSMQWVGLGNFEFLLSDPYYRASFVTTAIFSTLVTLVSMGVALYIAVIQMTANEPTANSKGIRLGSFDQIRTIIDEELEAVWAGDKEAQAALDTAVERGNQLLRRFEQASQ
jgi:ABC-type glycerol-3-phosphate transport system substrate-binding protein